jgi:KTSC domain
MTWSPLDSKMFFSSAYDASQRILYLRFRSGDVYRYFQFSQDDYQLFLAAESKGHHFLDHIRNSFPYERLAKLQVA